MLLVNSPHLCALCWSLCEVVLKHNLLQQRPGLSASTETLDRCHDTMVPQALTYHSKTLPCSSPKQDTSLHYRKPKALQDSIGESSGGARAWHLTGHPGCHPKTDYTTFSFSLFNFTESLCWAHHAKRKLVCYSTMMCGSVGVENQLKILTWMLSTKSQSDNYEI